MKNHKMHGKGILKFNGKIIHDGNFEDGEQIGESTDISHKTPTI